jgi:hypothetical protein
VIGWLSNGCYIQDRWWLLPIENSPRPRRFGGTRPNAWLAVKHGHVARAAGGAALNGH